jgi:hypothetical protein
MSLSMDKLPFELLLKILENFKEVDLEVLSQVDQRFNSAVYTILSDRYRKRYPGPGPLGLGLGLGLGIRQLTDILRPPDCSSPQQLWYYRGHLHRDGAPARITTISKGWYQHGKLHRVDGPAWQSCYENGAISSEQWHYQGQLHRVDGPAAADYTDGGINRAHCIVTTALLG